MNAKDRVDKDTGLTRCIEYFLRSSNQVYHLTESVNEIQEYQCSQVYMRGIRRHSPMKRILITQPGQEEAATGHEGKDWT